jgi:hypothetical protein
MDARKIQFLIAMQREIDKLEMQEGESVRVERLKSRFYDVVEVEEIAEKGKQETTNLVMNLSVSPEDTISEYANKSTKEQSARNQKDGNKNIPHKPKDVAAFLVRFRERKSRGLKYLTHRWSDVKNDNPLTYEEIIENAKKELNECRSIYTIPDTLFSKVREYVVEKTYSEINKKGFLVKHPHFFYNVVRNGRVEREHVYSGWSSDEMVEWAKNNPGGDPNQDDYWKKKLIYPFKQAIEVRDGMFEAYMRMNAEVELKDQYQLFNPTYSESLKEARFFTDVPTLFEGIRELLDVAKDKAKKPSLKIDYQIPESTGLFGIRQIRIMTDLDCNIGSLHTKQQLISGGNFGSAYEHFYGLCNWSILCKKGKDFIRINLLSDIEEINDEEIIKSDEVEGFTHVLTFYDL